MQWKTGERKKVLPREGMMGKWKDRGGVGQRGCTTPPYFAMLSFIPAKFVAVRNQYKDLQCSYTLQLTNLSGLR